MTPDLRSIRESRGGRPYIIIKPRTALQRRYFTRVARFISAGVVKAAQAAFNASMDTVRQWEALVSSGHTFSRWSGLLDKLTTDLSMVSRDRAKLLALQFHGPLPEMRGEL